MVVTATRVGQSPFEVPASIDRVSSDDINANKLGVNLSEDLNAIPGVLVRDRQNYAQDQQISIRGLGTRAPFGIVGTRLYVDGIPATAPDGQGQVSHFNLDSADRIEVLRGPFSALYGNAAGGVIQIFTAPATAPLQLEAEGVGGSYGMTRDSVNARGIAGPLNYNAGLTHFQTDGSREHSAARRESGNLRLAFDAGAATRITLSLNTVSIPEAQDALGLTRAQFDADPHQAGANAVAFNTRKSVDQTQGGLAFEHSFTPGESFAFMGYYGQRAVRQFQAIPASAQDITLHPLHSGGVIDLHNAYEGGDLRWISRGDLLGRPFIFVRGVSYDRQKSRRRGYENFVGSDVGVQGALRRDEDDSVYDFDQYAQGSWDFAERWSVLAGLRHSTVRFHSKDHYVVGMNPDDSGAGDYQKTSPVAGILFRASGELHLYASYGQGFDTPTFNELAYKPSGASGLNTDLRAARSDSGELGAKWRPRPSISIDAALFHSHTRDEIGVFGSSGGRTTYENVGSAQRKGAEVGISAALTEILRAQLAYTYLDTNLLSTDARIPGVPQHDLFAVLHFGAQSGWNAALEVSLLSRVPVNSSNSAFAPGYALIGANGGYVWELARWRVRLFTRVDNLMNRDYVGSVIVNESNGRYYESGSGRSAFAGIDLRFSG